MKRWLGLSVLFLLTSACAGDPTGGGFLPPDDDGGTTTEGGERDAHARSTHDGGDTGDGGDSVDDDAEPEPIQTLTENVAR